MKRTIAIFTLLLFSGLPNSALANRYTLKQCLTMAQPLAEEIKIAQESLVLARQDRIRARSALTPSLSFTSSFSGGVSDMDGASSPPKEMKETTYASFAGLGFRYSFYMNGRELIAFKASGELISKSRADIEAAKRDYALQVAAAFYDVIRRTRSVRIANANLTRLNAHKDAIHSRISAGLLTKTEAYRAQAEVAEGKAALTDAKNQLAASRSTLGRLVPLEEGFQLREPLQTIPKLPAPSLASAVEMGISMRPEIGSARLDAVVAGRQVEITKSLFWPKITLEGSAGLQNEDISGHYDATDTDFTRDTTAYNAKLTLSIPLIDGGLRSADVVKTKASERMARHRVRLAIKEVQHQVETAWYARLTQGDRVLALEETRHFSEQFLNATTKRFTEGMAQSLDLMDANTRLVEAENTLEDARFALMLAAIQLRHATGNDPVE